MFEKPRPSLRDPKVQEAYARRLGEMEQKIDDEWIQGMFIHSRGDEVNLFLRIPREEQEDVRKFVRHVVKRLAAGIVTTPMFHYGSAEDRKGESTFMPHDMWHAVTQYATSGGSSLVPEFRKSKTDSDRYSNAAAIEEEAIVSFFEGWGMSKRFDSFESFIQAHRAALFKASAGNLGDKNPLMQGLHRLKQAGMRQKFIENPSPLYLDMAHRYYETFYQIKDTRPLTSDFAYAEFKRTLAPLLARLRQSPA